jgi:polyisoprenoid-binding protein YceI
MPSMSDPSGDMPPAAPAPDGRRRRILWIAVASGLVVLLAGGFAVWYFVFRDTAPPAANIESAQESVDSKGKGSTASGVDGPWSVDTSVGGFDVAAGDFTSAYVGYRVNEELAGVGAKTAFGRTPDVSGTMTIDETTVSAVKIQADLTTLQSDEGQRDQTIHNQALESSRFPTATFELTKPIDLGKVPAEGATMKVDATGDLTLHGVTKRVTIPLDAKLVNHEIVVTGQLDIAFADYGIAKPVSFKVLSIEDRGIMELQLFFART